MSTKNYREFFFTAVIIAGLATALFGAEPHMDDTSHRAATAPVVQSIKPDTAG